MAFFQKFKKEKGVKMTPVERPTVIQTNKEKDKWFEIEGELAVDVFQTDDEVIIEAPVAGVKLEDLEITVEKDTIRIKGKRQSLEEVKSKNYFLQECYWGSFFKEIIVPVELDGDKTKATVRQGVLIIRIPKLKPKKKNKIKIKQT